MTKTRRLTLLSLCLFTAGVFANPFAGRQAAIQELADGSWIVSAGLGLTFSPTLFLLTPQLEYVDDSRLSYGPMIQLGMGDSTLVSFSGTARYRLGNHPKFSPNVEGGVGLIVGSSGLSGSRLGLHFMAGMGADYLIDDELSVGTSFRLNVAPPYDYFFVSWPIAVVRLRI